MNATPLAFRAEFSAPTESAFASPFPLVGLSIGRLQRQLLRRQRTDASWAEFPQGDGLLEAEALLTWAFANCGHDPRVSRLARAIVERQRPDGAWGRWPGGPADLDTTVAAYFSLVASNVESDAAARAAERLAALRFNGRVGARTRLLLALFGQTPFDDDVTAIPACSASEEWALQILDAYRPVPPRPLDPVIAMLFADEIRPNAPRLWNPLRRWSVRQAVQSVREHFLDLPADGANEPTSILPLFALHALGISESDLIVRNAWRSLDERSAAMDDSERIAPLYSPLRDTALAATALLERDHIEIVAGEWLWNRLVRGQVRGDLTPADVVLALPPLARGGWAFRGDRTNIVEQILHALLDEQDDDGGWGTPELTGMVLETLGQFGWNPDEPIVFDAIRYLEATQEVDCGWPGTLGVNYLHGTWRVLAGLQAVGHDARSIMTRRAVSWIKRQQHLGGGWGETPHGLGEPTAAQTAWALLALMAGGEANCLEVDTGITWLLSIDNDAVFTGRDPRGYHHHPLHAIAYPLMALSQFERHGAGRS